MVSTDAAARGIDIPDVTHVIQADFAASAVDFLHRVNRLRCMELHVPFAHANMWSILPGVVSASEVSQTASDATALSMPGLMQSCNSIT